MNKIKVILFLLLTNEIISISSFKNLKRRYQKLKNHAKTNKKTKDHSKHKSITQEAKDKLEKLCGEVCETDLQKLDFLKDVDIKNELFELVDLNKDENLSETEFMALPMFDGYSFQTVQKSVFQKCAKQKCDDETEDNNNQISKCEFLKCDLTLLKKEIFDNLNDIAVGLEENSPCNKNILKIQKLIVLFTKKDIVDAAFQRADNNLCFGSTESKESYDNLYLKEFKNFVRLAAMQNLFFVKYDKIQDGQLHNEFQKDVLPGKEKWSSNEEKTNPNIQNIEFFRSELHKGGDGVEELFNAIDIDNNHQLTQDEIINFVM